MTIELSRPAAAPMAGLEGQRVLLVGARHGVGPAVATALADAKAVVVDDAAQADVTEPVALVDRAVEQLGGLDVLIISAPPVRNKPVLDMTPEEMRSVIEDDLVGPALQMQAAARHMVKAGYGRIIAFMSMSGKAGVHHGVAPYAAAKGGMLTYMRVLAAETAEYGVTVNAIATALFEAQTVTMPQEKRDRLRTQIPVGRFGYNEEAAHAALYLASPLAGFVTGECLNLSGGRFMD
ncbi:MAG: 3-oxoacyl-[acyl-carrier protein] reductase [Devosia sp.]|nr:3-oxoacyl-[acyl-carrier protein] reductase [Devosia sp.]